MKQKTKSELEINKEVEIIHKEIQPALYEFNPASHPVFEESEETQKELSRKILMLTLTIKEKYPELSKYLEEMPVTIPNEKHPEITIENLSDYYDSLTKLVNNYELEHPKAM